MDIQARLGLAWEESIIMNSSSFEKKLERVSTCRMKVMLSIHRTFFDLGKR